MHVPNRASLQQFWESLVWSQQSSLLVSVVSKLFRHLSTIIELVVCFSILSTPPLGRASSAPYSWVLAPSHKTCFFNKKKTPRKILRRFSEDSGDCFTTQTLETAYTPDRQIWVLMLLFFFNTICSFINWCFFFCVWEWRRREGNEGGGRRGREREWVRGSLSSPLFNLFGHSSLSYCFVTFLNISQTVSQVVITLDTKLIIRYDEQKF